MADSRCLTIRLCDKQESHWQSANVITSMSTTANQWEVTFYPLRKFDENLMVPMNSFKFFSSRGGPMIKAFVSSLRDFWKE